jgi:hypothetical protein
LEIANWELLVLQMQGIAAFKTVPQPELGWLAGMLIIAPLAGCLTVFDI